MAAKRKSAAQRRGSARKSSRKAVRKARAGANPRKVDPIPKGMPTLAPGLVFEDAEAALAFYRDAFGAKELYRLTEPGGRIGHAEMKIGGALIMLSDAYPEMDIHSVQHYGGSPIRLNIAVKDTDKAFEKAVAAGAAVVRPPQNQFYGWRCGVVKDPFGYHWLINTQIEKVSPRRMQKRLTALVASAPLAADAAQSADGG